MTEAALGWPFLVARGRERGYRTILAPGFLTERRLHGLLSDSANGQQMDSSAPPREVEVERPGVGRLTLVYRAEPVTEAELDGGHDAAVATDEHGRPLEMLFGIVSRGRLSGQVDDLDLAAARGEALASYRRFLADESAFGVDASEAFALRGLTAVADPPPPPRPEPRRPERRTPRRRGAAAAAVVALVALPLALMLPAGGSEPHLVDVRASMLPSVGAIDCSRPTSFILEGVIESDAKADVVYHWEAPGWRGPSRQLAIDEAGAWRLPSERHDAASVPASGYVLVVEQPEPARVEAAYALRCLDVRAG